VLAGALVLGVVLGFSAPPDSGPTAEENSVSAASFLAADDSIL
jgi:hypothetical protein